MTKETRKRTEQEGENSVDGPKVELPTVNPQRELPASSAGRAHREAWNSMRGDLRAMTHTSLLRRKETALASSADNTTPSQRTSLEEALLASRGTVELNSMHVNHCLGKGMRHTLLVWTRVQPHGKTLHLLDPFLELTLVSSGDLQSRTAGHDCLPRRRMDGWGSAMSSRH